jgi:lipoprotein-anchoring transpeptidase ErfK/SrfK
VTLALVLGACSSPQAPVPTGHSAISPSTVPSDDPTPAAGPGPVLPNGTFVARAKTASLLVDKNPFRTASVQYRLPSTNAFGQPVSFLVTGTDRTAAGVPWLRIQLGVSPNGSAAWVAPNEVTVSRVADSIVVDLSERRLRYYHGGDLVDAFRVGVGEPQWPTTPGHYFIWAKVPQPSPFGPYGVYALGLSGFSTVLTEWPGGGRMAIHGTANPNDRGHQVSHGCIRVYNPDMETLKRVPMGTPVTIQK